MNCDEYLPLIEEAFDGEADERTARRVEEHLAVCAACASAFESLRREQELYLSYEFEANPPSPAFWPQVMARVAGEGEVRDEADATAQPLSARPRARRLRPHLQPEFWLAALRRSTFAAPRFSPTLTAALILIAVALTAGVMRYIDSRGRATNQTARLTPRPEDGAAAPTSPSAPSALPQAVDKEQVAKLESEAVESSGSPAVGGGETAVGRVESPDAGASETKGKRRSVSASGGESVRHLAPTRRALSPKLTPDMLVREAEQKYLAAIAILARDVRRNRSRLDASAAAQFEQTLATIDRTIIGTRRAVRQHPGDPVAVNYMLTAYAKKVEVLREMARY